MTKSSREIFKALKADGWYIARVCGDHLEPERCRATRSVGFDEVKTSEPI